jgi:hypothetical protein
MKKLIFVVATAILMGAYDSNAAPQATEDVNADDWLRPANGAVI